MLAGIKFVDRSEAERDLEEERKALKKQKKKEKKEKKKKKHKGKNSAPSGSKPGSDSDSEPASPSHDPIPASITTEATTGDDEAAPAAAGAVEREDWMTKSFPKAAANADAVPLPGAKPIGEKATDAKAAAAEPQEGLVTSAGQTAGKASPRGVGVGDGGASWRLKALARAKQQAVDASDPNYGRRVGDIVSEQWGSLAELTAGLTHTRAAHAKAHLLAARERQAAAAQAGDQGASPARASDARPPDRQGRGINPANYLQDIKSSRAQMRKPTEAASLSWRRGSTGSAARSAEPRPADRDRAADSPIKGHSRRDTSAEPRDREQDTHTDRHTDRHRGSPRDSERGRGAATAAGGSGAIGKQRNGGTDSRTDRHRREQARRPAVNPNSKQAELLALVASEMNTFSNDGTFMDKFAASQAGVAGRQNGKAISDDDKEQALSEEEEVVESDKSQQPAQEKLPEANQRAAAALKAGLKGNAAPAGEGNKATAAALRARLMGRKQPSMVLGPTPDSPAQDSGAEPALQDTKSVQLSAIDAKGRAVPGAFGRASVGAGAPEGGRKSKGVQRFDGGERQRYFADDDKQQLTDLVAQQRYEGAADIDANLADNIMRKGKRFREKELDVDEEYDVDGGLDMYESRKKKGTKEQQVKRDRSAQIADHRRMTNAVDRCSLCFSSSSRPRHLTISLGQTAYLALPARGRLSEGHSIIVPTEHVASTRQVDDHIWTELRNFKKCLLQMHMAQGMDVIFMETAMQLGDARRHAVVDCIPVPPAITAKAPLYFKKGIDDAESEWSQHHAKRMIETGGKGLRGSIPANFPYFHVEFNLIKGFVHVIDDETKFDPQFGRSIMIGLLDLPAEDMHRRAKTENAKLQQQWVVDFAKKWDAYDWTKQLG